MKRNIHIVCIFIFVLFLIFNQISPHESTRLQSYTLLYDCHHTYVEGVTFSTFNVTLSSFLSIKYHFGILKEEILQNYDVLIISTPVVPYSKEEIHAIKQFVNEGGGLLLMGNGWYWVDYHHSSIETFPYNQVSREFGVTVHDDMIIDPTDYYPSENPSYALFSNFAVHPVTKGVEHVYSLCACSLSISHDVFPVVMGDEDSYSGYHSYIYRPGEYPPVAAVMEYGKGRIIFLGHDCFFTNHTIGEYDNLTFSMNMIGWLAALPDNDKDGYLLLVDCNDHNSNINLSAQEICDGQDNNCDGVIDEGFDEDADGWTVCGGDCNDHDSAINPGAQEICDGQDNNCDGVIDEGLGNLEIIVIDSGGNIFSGANIYINGSYKGETNSNGAAVFCDLEVDKECIVEVEARGHKSQKRTVKIEKNNLNSIKFQMEDLPPMRKYILDIEGHIFTKLFSIMATIITVTGVIFAMWRYYKKKH